VTAPPGIALAYSAGSQLARLRLEESGEKKGYKLKISVPRLTLNASISLTAGEKVLDSIAMPAIPIRGKLSVVDFWLQPATMNRRAAKAERIKLVFGMVGIGIWDFIKVFNYGNTKKSINV
jgi:hypothetical protein